MAQNGSTGSWKVMAGQRSHYLLKETGSYQKQHKTLSNFYGMLLKIAIF